VLVAPAAAVHEPARARAPARAAAHHEDAQGDYNCSIVRLLGARRTDVATPTLASDQGSTQPPELTLKKPSLELWSTYAATFLVAVSVAILLPSGPSRVGVSVTTSVLIYSALGFVATLSGILGGLVLFRSVGQPGSSRRS
jgi:hypothetical protein